MKVLNQHKCQNLQISNLLNNYGTAALSNKLKTAKIQFLNKEDEVKFVDVAPEEQTAKLHDEN
ncbi:19208_t:CDS:2 [Cetraspora pellucida]|uniref:19208_t:CDS:1 n=1 Tax=Cetraspora pellucida TaxID=1433469 RepID=A0A9N9BTK3_9GLOM|nr:19208_t:CDS:2 [Cetraspora pellucida]